MESEFVAYKVGQENNAKNNKHKIDLIYFGFFKAFL